MTLALYDEMPYEREFEATVLACEQAEGGFKIILDQTLFFPEQGGQTSDIGALGEVQVSDVQLEGDNIIHYASGPLPVGERTQGTIDWAHRFNNMQQHTGEHIFTGLAHGLYGADNVGFHLSDNTVTLDLNIPLTDEQIENLEWRANRVIAANAMVNCYYPSPEELARLEYRSKKEIEGRIRIVEIEGVDMCACCAPHVASTAQVGLLKVIAHAKYKGGTRIYILCGLRALADYRLKQQLLQASYQALNCREEEVDTKVRELLEENKTLKYQISEIRTKTLLEKIENYPPQLQDVTIFTEGLNAKNLRDGVNALMERHEGLCAIFDGNDDSGYSFVIGSRTRDCSAIAKGLRELLNAKGGGSRQMAQGSVQATRSELEETL